MRLKQQPQTYSFEFHGKSEISHSDTQSNNTHSEIQIQAKVIDDSLAQMKKCSDEIQNEIANSLSISVPGIKFHVLISFHPGSIEWHGIVTALATNQMWQAAANLGSVLGLVVLVGHTVNTIVSKYLPANYQAPNTDCQVIEANANRFVQGSLEPRGIAPITELTILGHLRLLLLVSGAILGIIVVIAVYTIRQ